MAISIIVKVLAIGLTVCILAPVVGIFILIAWQAIKDDSGKEED